MSEDTKLDFYLKHRQQIEEWAALREGARQALDGSLLAALTALAETSGPLLQVSSSTVRYVRWRVPGAQDDPAWVELYWNPGQLLKGTGASVWPHLVLVVSQESGYAGTRARIKEATRAGAARHGLTTEGRASSPWLWSAPLVPAKEPITVDGYVQECLRRFEAAWTDLHPAVLGAIRPAPPGTR